ncbi:MAG: MFS transporter [Sporolactobacillus sp.]
MTAKHSFTCLWIGQSLAGCGDVFYIVGLMTVIYAATQSAFYMAAIPFFMMMMRFISGLLAPLILERLSLKSVLVHAQIIKSSLLLAMAMALTLHIYGPLFIWVFLLASTISFFDGWALPARDAMVPLLIARDQLVRMNSFLAILDQSINLGGWALGGGLAAQFGGMTLVWGTFILFVMSTICMALINGKLVSQAPPEQMTGKTKAMTVGWQAIGQRPVLRLVTLTDAIREIASVVWMAAILLVFVHQVLRVSAAWWGWINFSYFAGLIVSGMISFRIAPRIQRQLGAIVLLAILINGSVTLLFSWNTSPIVALILSFAIGAVEQMQAIVFSTLIQLHTDAALLPKVYAAQGALYAAVYGVGTLGFGFLTDRIGAAAVYAVSAGLLLASLVYVFLERKQLNAVN